MGLFEDYEADKDLQKDGKWLEFDGYKVLVAYAGVGNKKYKNLLEKLCEPLQEKLARTKVSKATRRKAHAAVVKTYARTIVLGWEGIKRGDTVVEYSPKVCEEILVELPEFFSAIQSFATELSNYQDSCDDDEDDDDEDDDDEDEAPVGEAAEKNS